MTRVLAFPGATTRRLGRGRRPSPRSVPARTISAIRGVWQADFFGPDGELVLIAIDGRKRLVAPPLVVQLGANRIEAANRLATILDDADPVSLRPKLIILRSRAQPDPVEERPEVACRCCDHRFAADRCNAAYCPACRRLPQKERRVMEKALRQARR